MSNREHSPLDLRPPPSLNSSFGPALRKLLPRFCETPPFEIHHLDELFGVAPPGGTLLHHPGVEVILVSGISTSIKQFQSQLGQIAYDEIPPIPNGAVVSGFRDRAFENISLDLSDLHAMAAPFRSLGVGISRRTEMTQALAHHIQESHAPYVILIGYASGGELARDAAHLVYGRDQSFDRRIGILLINSSALGSLVNEPHVIADKAVHKHEVGGTLSAFLDDRGVIREKVKKIYEEMVRNTNSSPGEEIEDSTA